MALLTALMVMLMMVVMTGGLTLTTMTESAIAANHRNGLQALYAAESGVDLGVSVLRTTPDWAALVSTGSASLVAGWLADLVQGGTVDSSIAVTVIASPDPNGDPDVLVLRSSATGPGGSQRAVQVTVRRLPSDASGARPIETMSWR